MCSVTKYPFFNAFKTWNIVIFGAFDSIPLKSFFFSRQGVLEIKRVGSLTHSGSEF